MTKVYIIEAEIGGDRDLVRYRVDKEVFEFFNSNSSTKAPDKVLQSLLANKNEWYHNLGVNTYHANTKDDIQKILDKILAGGGALIWTKAKLIEEGVIPLDDEDGPSGIGEHVGGFSSKEFHDWLNKNKYQVDGVYEVMIV